MLMHDHEEGLFPPLQNRTIWRYVDFTKFVSLLECQQLWFARADQFEDPYEGTWSTAGIKLLRDPSHPLQLPPTAVDQIVSFSTQQREEMFISCWNASEHESAAMWKLYLQSNEGVAIRSDYDSLAAVLERSSLKAGISMVQYVDYERVVVPFGNAFFPFLYKRLSFAHENELRAVIWAIDSINRPQIQKGSTAVTIDVKADELIKSVYVSPAAPKWFGQLIEQVIRRYGLQILVVRSTLYDRPLF